MQRFPLIRTICLGLEIVVWIMYLLLGTVSTIFGTPSGCYSIGNQINGGGTVLYVGPDTTLIHNPLSPFTTYYYQAWSVDGSSNYSVAVLANATTWAVEPSEHPTGFGAVADNFSQITLSWTNPTLAPDNYLIKASTVGYGDIVAPVDGVAEANSTLVHNITSASTSYQFSGLNYGTPYYFEIFPYNGTGLTVNYKTDGSIPQATATTGDFSLDLIISEVADPADAANAKFVELYNTGLTDIDFSTTTVYLARQANGGTVGSFKLNGIIASNGKFVIAYDTIVYRNTFGINENQWNGLISGNGDDGYFLYYGGDHLTGAVFDAYGVLDEDGTDSAWEYTDSHAVRVRSVTSPNTTWTASEWVIVGANADNMTPGFHAGTVNWQGTSSTDWNAKGDNWDSPYGYVPDASCIVNIPLVTNQPSVTEASACDELHLATDASLDLSTTGSLLVGNVPY